MFGKKKQTHRGHNLTLLQKDVPFQVTEAYKTLRTNLVFALSQKSNNILAISSALAAEGKSTTAANTAISIAQTNSKVLLIDADLRKPVQHRTFKLSNKAGLSTLLGGINSYKEVLNENVIPNLDIVTSGPIPPNPSEILASDNMKKFLGELSKYYDYVIIDTPPINIVTDTLTLLKSIAGVMLVAMQNQTPIEALEQAIDSINFAEGSILGIVMTNVDLTSSKYNYRYRYKYKYSYKYAYGSGNHTPKLEAIANQNRNDNDDIDD